ncbi:lycopene beta-cyclase [Altererythrobacter atlanticus]|uniref:Lycopene cyclase protein n=1 Tax=Croceibacterium atlanticum TaxID=1267766 RepID=A0A0F7KYY9_9SPHN|nr:lycopene beta-cyclase CrtY [Croceibacterium atlanticum]AKH44040.1 Lycopene cyclase protein [Croceibacterium atlanticum]MBB5732347.1 lycopene beta-cyclase [Croceibacterium atlanticum]
MNGRDCDIAIAGGGLAGGLIALALARLRPDVSVRLLEAGTVPGGNHRWSWFASDLSPAARDLMNPFRKSRWEGGYDVRFPAHERHLATSYRSLTSLDFAYALQRELAPGTLRVNAVVATLDAGGVTLESGVRITARTVIDCRGFTPTAHLSGGWQVFMGRHLRMAEMHGVHRPIIMDARVAQHGGYRFLYVLPTGTNELFLEDTYYQDGPLLDRGALSARLDEYARAHGWVGETISSETGVLPVITGGDFGAWQASQRVPGVGMAGAKGGFVHPLTSYTLPFAAQTALAIVAGADLPGEEMSAMLEDRARAHWRATRFYRQLGGMLFGAAKPEERYRVFQRFYRLPEPLIERFYAARSTRADRMRILCGKPPVPIAGALRALATSRPALQEPA